MKSLSLSASLVVLVAMSACGKAQDAPAPDAGSSAATDSGTVLTSTDTSDGPQIGERIPEPEPAGPDTAGETDTETSGSGLAAAGAEANQKAADLAARGVMEIGWEELMPEGEEERLAEMYQAQMASLYSGGGIAEGSAADQAIQIGTFNTVEKINGELADGLKIRLPGYTVPFEYGSDAQISEFLLVPYYGACLHAPPPPPNQTVFVKTEDKIQLKDLSQAVWIEGVLRIETQTSDLADAAYTIEMTGWDVYEY